MNRPDLGPGREPRTVDLNEDDRRESVRPLRRLSVGENSQGRSLTRETLTRLARQSFIGRRKRIALFGNWMFGEPAWDILLVLYIEEGRQKCTIGRLTELTGAAQTTMLRWLEALEKRGLVCRTGHPTDRRSAFINLTGKGEEALNLYFSDTNERAR